MDMSHLDRKYFLSRNTYNCPFCNRNTTTYTVSDEGHFDWSNKKQCYFMIVSCNYCKKRSLHLSNIQLAFRTERVRYVGIEKDNNLDGYIFHSIPSSFFALDKRIPKKLREVFAEAEGCLKSNFLTGASACARKVVYELAKREKATGKHYVTQLKSLKKKFPDIDSTYFDTLITVQETTSSKVHENASDAWESKHLRVILSALIEVLNEIYVIPKVKEQKRAEIQKMRKDTLPPKPRSKKKPSQQAD